MKGTNAEDHLKQVKWIMVVVNIILGHQTYLKSSIQDERTGSKRRQNEKTNIEKILMIISIIVASHH